MVGGDIHGQNFAVTINDAPAVPHGFPPNHPPLLNRFAHPARWLEMQQHKATGKACKNK